MIERVRARLWATPTSRTATCLELVEEMCADCRAASATYQQRATLGRSERPRVVTSQDYMRGDFILSMKPAEQQAIPKNRMLLPRKTHSERTLSAAYSGAFSTDSGSARPATRMRRAHRKTCA